MGSFKRKLGGRALGVGGALAVSIALAGAMAATTSAATTSNVQVTVGSAQANAGSVAVENITQSTTYGTCSAPSSPGSTTCTISVPALSGVLLIAQPATGEALGKWGDECAPAPGPVCHIQSGNGTTTDVTAKLAPAGSGPAVSASPEYTFGPTPNGCSTGNETTISGTGFAANSDATLSDDGTVVADGMTDGSGDVSFPYTPAASEPGIYRTFTVAVGGQSAGTDVYNSGHFCWGVTSPSAGMDQLTVNVSGLDPNGSDTYFQVANRTPIVIDTDATGSGSASTPAFACKSGTNVNWRIFGKRGTGTGSAYTFNETGLTFTCQ